MTNLDPCRCSCHKPGIGSNGECCDCHLARPYMPELKASENSPDEALNENFEYCNQLADRINLLAAALNKLSERVKLLESKKHGNEQGCGIHD